MTTINYYKISIFILTLSIITTGIKSAKAQVTNAALNKQVKVSSFEGDNIASKAVDGIKTNDNFWKTETQANTSKFIEIDLHKYNKISKIMIYTLPGETQKLSKQINLQYWDDANWTKINTTPIIDLKKAVITYPINPNLVTFMVKAIALDAPSICISEIEVIGEMIQGQPLPETPVKISNSKPRNAEIVVDKIEIGKTFKYVGYNQGYYLPGSNVSAWVAYSQINSMRIWTSLTEYAPIKNFNVKDKAATLADFEVLKSKLRSSPEKNEFINWDALINRYELQVDDSGNKMNFGYVLEELKRLKVSPVLQINERKFEDTWNDKWEHWQRYYALAYYAARKGNASMFAMQNEPNHKESGPMDLPSWMIGLQIASDAVKCALDDVNKKYKTNLQPKFVAPITAGYNTDWWAYVVSHIRDGYDGKKLDKDLFDIFSTHSYNQPANGYTTRTSDIRKIIQENHPEGKSLPIVFTEIGRWMNSLLIDKKETYDSPSVFTEWAGIYANNLKNQAYGMWAFKFANTYSSTYTQGIKSGHHLTWRGKRIVEDAYVNLAKNKKVISTSGTSKNLSFITDGDKNDSSTWISDSTNNPKLIEIELGEEKTIGSAVVYTGSSFGVYTGPDRVKNFELQYWINNQWQTIPGSTIKDGKYVQQFIIFKNPIKTSKVRWISSDKGVVKLREIKLFKETESDFETDNYNITGLHRTGEVVRLFATGFKDERPLLKTYSNVENDRFDHYTSYDEKSGNYYMWLVQRDGFDYHLKINLADLNIPSGSIITAQTVSPNFYGEVTEHKTLADNKEVEITLPAQGVMLLTISGGKDLVKTEINPANDAYVSGGIESSKNYGRAKTLEVALNAEHPENNKVTYLNFDLKDKTEAINKVILAVNGKATGNENFRIHVYAIPNQSFDESLINWKTSPLLDQKEALINQVASKAFVAGELVFDEQQKNHYLDVTDVVKTHPSKNYTFVLIRETRELGDDIDKNRTITINSKESDHSPQLIIWKSKE